MKEFEILRELPKCDRETWIEQMLWKNDGNRLVQQWVVTILQFAKSIILQSAIKPNAIKQSMPVLIFNFCTDGSN